MALDDVRRRRAKHGQGSLRSRRPGTWEIRVTVHVRNGPGEQRSFTHYGDEDSAVQRKAELIQLYGARRRRSVRPALTTVGALLDAFIAAPHNWCKSTWRTTEGRLAVLRSDAIRKVRLAGMTTNTMELTLNRWKREGAGPSNVCAWYRLLNSAMDWGVEVQIMNDNPLDGMSAPVPPPPRQHLRPGEVQRLRLTANEGVEEAAAALKQAPHRRREALVLFRAEQTALLVRVAADAGLTRGELTALKTTDLTGRVLTVRRVSQDGDIVEVKDHRRAGVTLAADTARYWQEHVRRWHASISRGLWLFTSTPEEQRPLVPASLGTRFENLAEAAGLPGATLHRLRHTVGTYLVAQNKILEATKRLRLRNPAVTLQMYRHALPIGDEDVADTLARLYGLDELEQPDSPPADSAA